MVRLTQTLCKYIPEWYNLQRHSNGYFRKQNLFFLTRFYNNIGWSTRKNAINRFHYVLKGEQYFAKLKSGHRTDINRSRIAAACEEHGYNYFRFRSSLQKIDINLNLAALARLAIYEPKTFKSLVEICRRVNDDDLQPASFHPNHIQ